MSLDKNIILFVLLISFQNICSNNLYSQTTTDSLISPHQYKISYDSPKISQLKKYYTKIAKNASHNKDYKKMTLTNIYLAETHRYENKNDSSQYYLNKSKRLISKHHIADDFIKYQYFKAKAASVYFTDTTDKYNR